MSEESNDGTMSGLVKTIVGVAGTLVTAGGAWLGSHLFGGGEAETAQPAQTAAPVINITNANQQAAPAGKTIIVERPASGGSAQPAPAPKPKPKTAKEELEEAPKW
jgi:hypothetical protein